MFNIARLEDTLILINLQLMLKADFETQVDIGINNIHMLYELGRVIEIGLLSKSLKYPASSSHPHMVCPNRAQTKFFGQLH